MLGLFWIKVLGDEPSLESLHQLLFTALEPETAEGGADEIDERAIRTPIGATQVFLVKVILRIVELLHQGLLFVVRQWGAVSHLLENRVAFNRGADGLLPIGDVIALVDTLAFRADLDIGHGLVPLILKPKLYQLARRFGGRSGAAWSTPTTWAR